MVTLQIVRSLRFKTLAVNTNSPVFSVVKLWKVSPNIIIHNVFICLQHVLQNVCCFLLI